MKTKGTVRRIAALAAAIAGLSVLAAVGPGAASAHVAPSTGQATASARGTVPAGMTAPQYRALMIRSEALNLKYGLGGSSKPTVAPASGASDSFAWGAFGIGAAAALGLVLLAGGAIAGSRFTRQPRVRTS
jgi:hypothetical protein